MRVYNHTEEDSEPIDWRKRCIIAAGALILLALIEQIIKHS